MGSLPDERLREAILRVLAIPSPITGETLRLKERGLLEPKRYSYSWWRQLGFDEGMASRLSQELSG